MEDYDLLCIFDLQLLVDPVRAEDGKTYSRANIEKYFESREAQSLPIVSPLTRAEIGKKLTPDTEAAKAVAKRSQSTPFDFKALIPGARSIHDLGEVFSTLDSVREVLSSFLDGWQPPQLVMVGKESSGKSSVLERLCMMPIFPRADNVCTRTPIHVRLRNSKTCQAATLEVFNTQSKQTEDGPHVIPTDTGAVDVKAKMDAVLQKEGNQRLSMDRVIIIRITSPFVPSIDLIDMPGLVTSPPEDRDRTRQLVTQHISQHGKYSIYLATVTADDAPNTSAAMEIVQAHGLQGRTVGVFTMVDEVVPRKWDMFMQRLQSPSEPDNGGVPITPHGWVPVVNATVQKSGCPNNIGKLVMQARDEEECLNKLMPVEVAAGRAGCGALVGKLHALFFDFLREEWGPKTVRMLQAAVEATELEGAVLGLPAYHEPRTAEQAKKGAVREAEMRLRDKAVGLTDTCCKSVLASLKTDVRALFAANPISSVGAGKLPGLLREHSDKVHAQCDEYVGKWADYWVGAVRAVLESKTAALDANAGADVRKQRIENAEFELARFPAFIEAALKELEALLECARASLKAALERCMAVYYAEMSPWLKISTNFDAASPVATVTFDVEHMIENVTLAFVREADALVAQELCGRLEEVAGAVKGKEAWVEGCSAERVVLLAKMHELKRAQGEILWAVFETNCVEGMEEKLKKP